MRKFLSVSLGLFIIVGCLSVAGCGGGKNEPSSEKNMAADSKALPKDAEKIKRDVMNKVKRMQDRILALDAKSAAEIALKEAKKWDSDAQVYSLEGEESLKPDGTAKKWSAYFAVREDPENAEQGKKFVVLLQGDRVALAQKKETPDDISYTKDCRAFLPTDRMSSASAYSKCYDALKEKYGDKVEEATPERLACFSGEYYISSKWEIKPTWRLTLEMEGSPVSAAVHALTGEVLEVK